MMLAPMGLALAQQVRTFSDSIVSVLQGSRQPEAVQLAGAFQSAWPKLLPDIRSRVIGQVKTMRAAQYRTNPEIIQYLGAVVAAQRVLPDMRFGGWLTVADSVIRKDAMIQASRFFTASKLFFAANRLHKERAWEIRTGVSDFSIEYLIPEPPPEETEDTEPPPPDTTIVQKPVWMSVVLPPMTGPVIRFNRVSITLRSATDSLTVTGVSGTYNLFDNMFNAENGKVSWPGLNGVYYQTAGPWQLDTSRPEIVITNGRLMYIGMLSAPEYGLFSYRTGPLRKPQEPKLPEFRSYGTGIELNRITYPGLKFRGGFSLNGTQTGTRSVNGTPSLLRLTGEGGDRFAVSGIDFHFMDSVVEAKDAHVSLYHGGDSIVHPSVDFVMELKHANVQLSRSRGRLRDAPFESSYFRMDFSASRLYWNLERDSVDLYSASVVAQDPVILESKEHFNANDFRLLGGVGFSFHPLVMVVRHTLKTRINPFYADDLVRTFNKPAGEIRTAMEFLASKGLIDYDRLTGSVLVKDKAILLVRSNDKKSDYDNLKILSIPESGPNASMNLRNGSMTVRGVEQFTISDSLNLNIKPDSSIITLGRNRDLKFSGRITAGNFEINGKDFDMNYDSFSIVLSHIDSIRFLVMEKNAKGQMVRRRLSNSLMGSDSTATISLDQSKTKKNGTLYINLPNNKSGRKTIPQYPRLDASAGGLIYFDRRSVLNGVYGRSVYFVVPPFKLDSLGDADPASINFEGTFLSSGMFPAFKEKLHAMADKSLGFTHTTPVEGYGLFNGPGNYKGTINLDNKGIVANGIINFMAATVSSEKFVFYPDSVVTRSRSGSIEEKEIAGISFPQADFPEFRLRWQPRLDKFAITSLKDPFKLYQTEATLNGKLIVSTKGLLGTGQVKIRGSAMKSEDLIFAGREFTGRHADFKVDSDDPTKPAIAAEDVRVRFDLRENEAEINPEVEGTDALTLPYVQFKTSIPSARWDLDQKKIFMSKSPDVAIENSYFHSTRKDLDSLAFMATGGEYDIASQTLKVTGIPYIGVADARITPENGEVLIMENAKIGQLRNTVIVLDTLTAHHRLTAGVINIVSSKEFNGYGIYEYVNALRDTFRIRMTDFHLDTAQVLGGGRNPLAGKRQTVAYAMVTPQDKMLVAPRIYYKGRMTMYARRPALQMKGYVKLDLKRIKNYDTWLTHEQSGEEKQIYVDFDNAVTETGAKAAAGIHYAPDHDLYATFITDKRSQEDEDFFLPSGKLFYDTATREFRIEDPMKASGDRLSGKVLSYREEKQEVKFEGPVSFFRDSKEFRVQASAIGFGNLESDEVRMNALVTTDFDVPPTLTGLMAQSIGEVLKLEQVPDGRGDPTELLYKVANLVGEETAKEYEKRSLQTYVPLANVPGMAKTMVLSNVDLKWSPKVKGFYSVGEIGLSNLGRTDLNGSFDGFLELRKNEDGSPVFNLFLKVSPEVWYYFGYEDSRLMIHSSVAAFNDQVYKRSNAGKGKGGTLIVIPGSDEEAFAFVRKFRSGYLNIDAPYDVRDGRGPSASKEKDKKKKDEKDDGF